MKLVLYTCFITLLFAFIHTHMHVHTHTHTHTQAAAFLEPASIHFSKPFGYPIPALSYGTQLCTESPACCTMEFGYFHFYDELVCPRILMNVTVRKYWLSSIVLIWDERHNVDCCYWLCRCPKCLSHMCERTRTHTHTHTHTHTQGYGHCDILNEDGWKGNTCTVA